jgi:hypothetical protein
MSNLSERDAIPPEYREGSSGLNRTIAALIDRGLDIQLAQSLRDQGYTLAKLQQMTEAELSALSILPHSIKSIRQNGRPPIPDETLSALLIANRFTCCVCQDSSQRIIVHHIEEWSVSRSHEPGNLAVLCLNHHDMAHQRGGLSANLTPDLVRRSKREWEDTARSLPPGVAPSAAFGRRPLYDGDKQQQHAFFQRVSDFEIGEELDRLRKFRCFDAFDARGEAKRLADKVEQSEFAGGSREVRAKALAWCARILAGGETLELAKQVLSASKGLMQTEEGDVAEAAILANADKEAGLSRLFAINTPLAQSAALRIVVIRDGNKAALAWAERAGLDETNLDPDGKYAFLLAALVAEGWNIMFRAAAAVTEQDFAANAGLLHVVAMARLLQAVPVAERTVVAQQVPLEPAEFPLSSEPAQIEDRVAAHALFLRLAELCRSAGVMPVAYAASDYALWLKLRDPNTQSAALEELRESLRESVQLMRRLNLALKFGIKLDIAAIERQLDQSSAFSEIGTADEAFARYALIFVQPGPKEAALYIAKHRDQLFRHLQKIPLMGVETEILARSGQIAAAKERLAEAIGAGMGARDVAALNAIVAESSGQDPVAERRALYEQTGELRALRSLAEALEAKGMWEDLLPYAQRMFAETHDVADCFLEARALDKLERYGELFAFLSANAALIEASPNLRGMWAWTLWREGKFNEANEVLRGLSVYRRTDSLRTLSVNIAISSGDWAAINVYCDEIWADRSLLEAETLLHAAELGQAVGNLHTRELVVAATQKAPQNAAVLANAYFQAVQGGWEETAQIAGWIEKAAACSGDRGPVKMASLKELVDQKPAWDRQANDVAAELNAGRLPAFAAADVLHRSLMDFTLVPALANPSETDVRKRGLVYAYSGARKPLPVPANSSIAVELGALFTLARLDLLELVFRRFRVVIPHTTLGWLFRERARAVFHQPSRIKDAQLLKQLLNTHAISILAALPKRDHDLTKEIGDDLADMLIFAKSQSEAGTPSVVVRSAPLYRLGSFMQENADIAAYADYIVSCSTIVDVLKAKGVLTAQEETRARAFLRTQERGWPREPAVDSTTQFLLDGLAITYLRTASVLSKFKSAGLKVFIAQSDDDDANALLAVAGLNEDKMAMVERIRAQLEAGLADGTVQAIRATKADQDREFQTHPTYAVLALSRATDLLLIDDRALNQHPQVAFDHRITSVVTTLDLLDHLKAEGALSESELLGARTTLRQCGYQIIPVTEAELRAHIIGAAVKKGTLLESAELRAIRESLLQARMAGIVQLPLELPALQMTRMALMRMIREVWLTATSAEDAAARADWLLRVADIRLWASAIQKGRERDFVNFGYAEMALQLLVAPSGADQTVQQRYFDWLTERVLNYLQQQQPQICALVLARIKKLVTECVEQGLKEEH